jgi:hypothetical protein
MMAGFESLEIVVGLVFVYLLLSILVTLLVEYCSAIFKLRAENLKKIIERALDDDSKTLSVIFYKHPLIKYLSQKNGKLPSYLGSDKFAKTVLDIIRTKGNINDLGKSSTLDHAYKISDAINDIDILGDETKALLKSFAKEANEDINDFGTRLEAWYNELAERGSGWFNRKIKVITYIISFLVAVSLNANSISIYQQLSKNSDLRTQIADGASNYLKNNESLNLISPSYDSAQNALEDFYTNDLKANTNMLQIGWNSSVLNYLFSNPSHFFLSLLGWLITSFAIALGAPFWFDLLNKLVSIRAAGKQKNDDSIKRLQNQIKQF